MVKDSGNKVTIIHQDVFEKFEPILRTFNVPSKKLMEYLFKLTGKQVELPNESDLKKVKGLLFWGQVEPAKNPKYVNLVCVWELISRPNPHSLTDKEVGQGGSHNVGQNGFGLP